MKQKNDFTEKPYNRCLSCHHRKEHQCDGPRTSGLLLERWWEYMRDLKEINDLSNAYIAEEAELSVKTIEKVLGPNPPAQDIMRDTARRIENAIIGSTSKYPCFLAFEEENRPDEQRLNNAMIELERVMADNKDYRVALDNIHASYQTEMDLIRAEAQKKIDFLMEQVQRLNRENDNLWAENNRKSKVVDMFLSKQDFILAEKKTENK